MWEANYRWLFFVIQLTELKADHWEKEKELRQKMVQMQKQQAERMEGLQVGTFEMSFVNSMILNILSSTKFGLLVYNFIDSLSWLKFENN